MAIRQFFPTHLWIQKLALSGGAQNFNKKLLEECYAFRELDTQGRSWSKKNYVAGYTSYSSIANLHERSSRFESLKLKLDREVLKFAKYLEMDLGGKRLTMSAFWLNIMGSGTHHSFHLHPLSAISGTYYVRVPKDSGSFKIEDPRITGFMGSPPRKSGARAENRRYLDIKCKPGEAILFESWLKHEVPANRSSEERVSVSFNYDWV